MIGVDVLKDRGRRGGAERRRRGRRKYGELPLSCRSCGPPSSRPESDTRIVYSPVEQPECPLVSIGGPLLERAVDAREMARQPQADYDGGQSEERPDNDGHLGPRMLVPGRVRASKERRGLRHGVRVKEKGECWSCSSEGWARMGKDGGSADESDNVTQPRRLPFSHQFPTKSLMKCSRYTQRGFLFLNVARNSIKTRFCGAGWLVDANGRSPPPAHLLVARITQPTTSPTPLLPSVSAACRQRLVTHIIQQPLRHPLPISGFVWPAVLLAV